MRDLLRALLFLSILLLGVSGVSYGAYLIWEPLAFFIVGSFMWAWGSNLIEKL